MKLLVVVMLLLLAGCQTTQGMSAEQITAASKDKSVSCMYTEVITIWGQVKSMIIGYDQKTITNGGVVTGDKCSTMDVKDSKPAPTPPVVAPKVP